MENIRNIVAKNLVTLRKEKGLTQLELAQKINFSDKALSRWEKGEVLPDIETIEKLSNVYNVSISSILENQDDNPKTKFAMPTKKDILSQAFLICEIWVMVGVIYAYFRLSKGINFWPIFLWGVPATALFLIIQNRKNPNNILCFIYATIFVWSFITSLYLYMLKANPWYFFLLGVPIQGMLIVRYLFNYKQSKFIKIKRKK
jgi:transcriptional regulator with XRE-family HTH domain